MTGMSTHVSATEAARMLGVTKPTLYAYVSRGLVSRSTSPDGRTSLYPRADVERLAERARSRRDESRPTIDLEISSSITELDDDGVAYRGRDAATLARTHTYEQVAELLWTGELAASDRQWAVDRTALTRCRRVIEAAGATGAVGRLALAATTLAGDAGSRVSDGAAAARRLLALAPSMLGGPASGDIATRLAATYRRRPPAELVAAVSRALVLLADHELATSTLAVRVACSVRADPYSAIAVGLGVVGGPLHGAASIVAADLFDAAVEVGPREAVDRVLRSGQRLPGFGHSVYRNGDPRLVPLLESVRRLPGSGDRMRIVDEVLVEAGRRIGKLPNIDLGLAALVFVARLPGDGSLFAVARIAGWGAHYDEERDERPVRYRGLTTKRPA